jgi:hypothetical protein
MSDKKEATTDLEREFEALADSVGEQIKAHIKEAQKALRAAIDLSEAHGVPFFSSVSELGIPYIPDSFRVKYRKLNKDFVINLTDLTETDLGAYGWATSQIC